MRAEAYLINDLCDVVKQRVDAISRAQGRRFRAVSANRFYLDDRLYEVRIAQDPLDPTVVQIGVLPLGAIKTRVHEREPLDLPLDGLGQLTRARVWIDGDLSVAENLLAADVSSHFAGGYRWLESHVVGELLAVEHRATIELYMEIRSHLTRKLADLVALYGMDRRNAFYLLDPRAIQTALARTAENRASLASSPIELTAQMTTQLLDPGETVAQASLAEDRTLSLKLSESRYAQTGLNLAEDAFYKTSQVESLPLVREGRVQLTAVFPSDLRQEIEPVLIGLGGRCREILQRNGKFSVERVIGRGRNLNARVTPGDVAELLGRFAGGYSDSLQ